jgi:hypothetical protein
LNALIAGGVPLLSPAHDFLDGKLRAAWIADPDGNPSNLFNEHTESATGKNRRYGRPASILEKSMRWESENEN